MQCVDIIFMSINEIIFMIMNIMIIGNNDLTFFS